MNTQPRTWMWHLHSKRDARYEATIRHDERFDVLRSLAMRRGLVLVTCLVWLTMVVLIWYGLGAAYLAAALLGLAGYVLLNRAVRLIAGAPAQALDERLVAVRNAAYRTSYRIVAVVTALTLLAVSLAVDARFGWNAFDLGGHHLRTLLIGFVALAALTPTAVLAWREREI